MRDATPPLRMVAAARLRALDRQDGQAVQVRTLRGLLRRAATTRFGRAHGFADLLTTRTDELIAAYRRAVPLRTYERFWAEWWGERFPRLIDVTWPGRIPYFANSSGTSGGPTKRIPVSRDMVRANRATAFDVIAHHLAARPRSRLFAGRNIVLGGATTFEALAPGVRAGDLSGIAAAEVPLWARARAWPPRRIALLADWDRKMAAIAALARDATVTSISGTPSWMVLFFARLAAGHGSDARLVDCLPDLELLVHGGVGFAPYRERFAHWMTGGHAETREVFAASEGFFGVADRADGEGLRLALDHGLFFEFVRPEALDDPSPDRRWVGDADIGVEYALVVTTNAGLWSYVVGDTVTLVDRAPPRLLVTGRVGWSLSVAGEHLIGAELDVGMAEAARIVGATVADYVAAAHMPDERDQRAGHVFVVELSRASDPALFGAALDAALSRINEDYAAHRRDDVGMRPPDIRLVPVGFFEGWMRSRGKFGGQNKVPRVISDTALLRGLLARAEAASTAEA